MATEGLLVELARVDGRGRTTIPKQVRVAAGLGAGDTLAFEVQAAQLVVRKVPAVRGAVLDDLALTLDEWSSPEDEAAWRDL